MSGKHSPECRVGDCNECGDDPTSRANAIIRAKDAERKLAAAQAEIAELRDLNTTVRSVRVLRAVKERDAAQAKVAQLKEELERADEANDESEQVRRVVAEAEVARLKEKAEQDWALNSAALAEIAALRRVLAGVVDRCSGAGGVGGYVGQDGQFLKQIRAALSAPSAAEPLLADIRVAVLALARLREWLPQPTDVEDPDDLASLADDSDLSDAALTGLRRWVP